MSSERGCVAAGSEATAAASAGVLEDGGTAVDAAVAGGFAAMVAEPQLASAGGGGFCLVRDHAGRDTLVDFFVDVPARLCVEEMDEIVVRFSGGEQSFWVGWASVAVPGALAGLVHLHRRWGTVDLEALVAPALRLAREGVVVSAAGAYLFEILTPILAHEPASRAVFTHGGAPLREGDVLRQPELAEFLGLVGRDPDAALTELHECLVASDATVDATDLERYRVREREPLRSGFRDLTVVTNPPPSHGGTLMARHLALLDEAPPLRGWQDAEGLAAIVGTQKQVDRERPAGATQGTTHLSIADGSGGVVAMTLSNGSNSGCLIGRTGVAANNMLGEDDLFPGGFGTGTAGIRIPSMMCPTFVVDRSDRVLLALGSGGSKRIRTAIAQVVARHVDHEPDLAAAVAGPRLHWDGSNVQAEPGLAQLVAPDAEAVVWPARDLYFGGVHAVVPGRAAAGDPRRGGVAAIVEGSRQ